MSNSELIEAGCMQCFVKMVLSITRDSRQSPKNAKNTAYLKKSQKRGIKIQCFLLQHIHDM